MPQWILYEIMKLSLRCKRECLISKVWCNFILSIWYDVRNIWITVMQLYWWSIFWAVSTKNSLFQLQDILGCKREYYITNIFWTNARMKFYDSLFGNYVTLDMTYRMDKWGILWGIFIGFNHHQLNYILGLL